MAQTFATGKHDMTNTVQIASFVRILVVAIGSMLATRGIITEEQATYLGDSALITGVVGAVAALVAAFLGVWSRRKSALVATVAKMPEVASVVTTEKLAAKVDAISASAGAKVQVQ